ncbi:MAG: glucose-6-phosphate dehydrogenase assembly protein OpcA [Terrimicrobiaceae bacterium]|nr:glucose-6-phosphate dehydrogenase assembly protein OpcA [Terrimicrobiaceae bacterium]
MSDLVTITPGLPVEIGRIEKELGKLWEESGDGKTRASLINLAIYTESAAAVDRNTELIAQIATEHACRAILIFANRTAAERGAKAWINAHCHAAGKHEICSEQITFQLDGDSPSALTNVVFAHLDSDLPLCFWSQAPFREPLDSRLWSWIDRLIFDSNDWDDPAAQFALVRKIATLGEVRTALCDLNWTRLLSLRLGLAHFFDNACALPYLRQLDHVEIVHAPGARISALLLLGWLAHQLDWKLDSVLGRHAFRAPDRREVTFEFVMRPGACISSCRLAAGDASFQLDRAQHDQFYHATMSGGRFEASSQLLPAGRDRITETLLMELSRGGRHPLYLKALDAIQPLLAE